MAKSVKWILEVISPAGDPVDKLTGAPHDSIGVTDDTELTRRQNIARERGLFTRARRATQPE